MKLKELLNEETVKLLSESTLDAIQEAFDKKVELTTEAALVAQDELYAEKLDTLIKAIDKDHTTKMKRLVESIDKDRAQKLLKVVKKYERALNEDSKQFKAQLVESISNYLDEFLEESISQQDLSEAVKNKTAMNVLTNLRKVFAIDSVMMKESIQDAVLDGKTKIDSLTQENTELKDRLRVLEEGYNNARVQNLIEEKIANFDDEKRSFVRKTLKDKSYDFVKENFEYVSRLFDKKEKEKIRQITEEAKEKAPKIDFIKENKEIVEEKVNTTNEYDTSAYVDVLSKTFGKK